MKRKLSTLKGRSPSRACLIVFPWFWDSSGPRRSISDSIRFASLNKAAARSPGVRWGHLPLSNASLAASIAARVSCRSDCGTAAIFPPVAGLITVYVASVCDGTHSPFTKLRYSDFPTRSTPEAIGLRSEEHTSELQSLAYLVCRLLLEKK